MDLEYSTDDYLAEVKEMLRNNNKSNKWGETYIPKYTTCFFLNEKRKLTK